MKLEDYNIAFERGLYDAYTVEQYEQSLIAKYPRAKTMIAELKDKGYFKKEEKTQQLLQEKTRKVANMTFYE
jgi:hypothetical protein